MRMRWIGHVACMFKRTAYRILVVKPEGKPPLCRPRLRWVDVEKDLTEIGWSGMEEIDLPQVRGQWSALVILVMNLHVP
jgi:hypothetical protein